MNVINVLRTRDEDSTTKQNKKKASKKGITNQIKSWSKVE